MIQKGVYPYDHIDSYHKIYVDKLPSQLDFYGVLSSVECSDENYEKAQIELNTFICETFLDYHNIYLISDVLLLADIWYNFRNVCYKIYGLDCCYYYTAPSLSWDAMLKITNIELELLTDIEKYLFVESGIHGGISQISHRYAEAKNKYLKNYDKKESYILYLDANNLYGGAMCEYLPIKDFEWNKDKWTKEKILSLSNDAKTGYLFSVNLSLDESLYSHFNNYPIFPELLAIKTRDRNLWQQENHKENYIKKLCLRFHDKKNYVVNYRCFKLALSLGYNLDSVKNFYNILSQIYSVEYRFKKSF